MTIKAMYYEKCRENFFVNLIKHAENKIKYWNRQKGYRCEIEYNLANARAEISYCQDALKALEKQIPKKVIHYNKTERHCECGAIVKSFCQFCYECGQALDWSDQPIEKNSEEV